MKSLAILAVVALIYCAPVPDDPCEGRYNEWFCQLRDCQPDGDVPEGARLSWPLDRRRMIDDPALEPWYDPEVHCLNPDPPCCPEDWAECGGMERCR